MVIEKPSQNLAAALIDVRCAYRLLWTFQQRILSYKDIIQQALGFTEVARFSMMDATLRTSNPSWSLLPMADMDFTACRRHDIKQYPVDRPWQEYPLTSDALLYIRVRADTGIPALVRNDPNPLTFDAVEACKTILLVFILVNHGDRERRTPFWDIVRICRDTLLQGNGAVGHTLVQGYSIFGQNVDLDMLPDKQSLIEWINQFRSASETALGVDFTDFST